jgi:hypothetical protein
MVMPPLRRMRYVEIPATAGRYCDNSSRIEYIFWRASEM